MLIRTNTQQRGSRVYTGQSVSQYMQPRKEREVAVTRRMGRAGSTIVDARDVGVTHGAGRWVEGHAVVVTGTPRRAPATAATTHQ